VEPGRSRSWVSWHLIGRRRGRDAAAGVTVAIGRIAQTRNGPTSRQPVVTRASPRSITPVLEADLPGVIDVDDPRAADIRELLGRHLDHMRSLSPPEAVFALDLSGLLDPAVTLYSYRRGGTLLAIGALKHLDDIHGELKSMHTAEAARGAGIGRAMLMHLMVVARERGYRLLSLETGSMAGFAPARALYASAGFTECGAFADYQPSPHSTFMSMPPDS
jgi:putative acetyltransferase